MRSLLQSLDGCLSAAKLAAGDYTSLSRQLAITMILLFGTFGPYPKRPSTPIQWAIHGPTTEPLSL